MLKKYSMPKICRMFAAMFFFLIKKIKSMKKVFVKVSVAAVFVAALLGNVSLKASKGAGDTSLFGLISVADARTECPEYKYTGGKCYISGNCYPDAGNKECSPN